MNIKKYLWTLIRQKREGDTSPELDARIAYARAYMQGEEALSKYRERRIEEEVRKKYTHGAEVRIALDYIKAPTNTEYTKAFIDHEEYVTRCKTTVDAEIIRFRAGIGI